MRRAGRHLAIALFASACLPSYAVRGDQAAATGQWKTAVAMYASALREEPATPDLRRKYEDARSKALEQSLATARRCNGERDMACVNVETSYVLELDAGNAEAATLRSGARVELAAAAVARSREQMNRGEFLLAVNGLAEARGLTVDPTVLASASALSQDMAQPAVVYVQALMQSAQPADLERQVQLYGESIQILREVVQYVPDQVGLLAQAKTGYEAGSAELQRRRQAQFAAAQQRQEEARQQQMAVAARAEADSHRTVSVVGAVIGPGKADGTAWDGLGRVSEEASGQIVQAFAGSNPVGAVVAALAGPAMHALGKPDVKGHVELYADGQQQGWVFLDKQQDSFNPSWTSAQYNNVDIRSARLRIVLVDEDPVNDDDIGVIEVDTRKLEEAVEAGSILPIRVDGQTNGQVLFVNISVM